MSVRAGRFVTLEGIDGAGKSTHLERMAQWLRDKGHDVEVTREPGGTELAEALRALVLHQPMDTLTEALLMFAARRDHLVQRIEPALRSGVTVLCDRFTDASFAYQGAGRGFSLATLGTLETWVQEGRQPDLTVWFDLPASTAAARRGAVRAPDRFEQQDEAFFERVRSGYLARMTASPQRFMQIDASVQTEVVWAKIRSGLERLTW
jgi:dTMP kinase